MPDYVVFSHTLADSIGTPIRMSTSQYRLSESFYPQTAGMKTVGQRIKDLREARKMTQPQLAKAVDVGQSTLNEIETGATKSPSSPVLLKLARFFEVDPVYLQTGKGPQHPIASMTDQESELLLLYRALSDAGRGYLLSRARDMHKDEHRGRDDQEPAIPPLQPERQARPRKGH